MIMPTKHISSSHSLLGVGGLILSELRIPRTVTALWEKVQGRSEVGTFDRFLLALDMLYLIGAVELRDGLLMRGTN